MKIAVDISQIIYGTGVSSYSLNLLSAIGKIDKKNDYILYGGSLRRRKEMAKKAKEIGENFKVKTYPIPPRITNILWNRLHILKIERFIGKVDVVHTHDWVFPPSKAFKVATVHDLSPMRFPKLTNPLLIANQKARLKWIKKEADAVIVPSIATKEDLTTLKFDSSKIHVIPEASDPFFKPATKKEVAKIKAKYNIDKYLLAVGANKRKNIERIVEAYTLLADSSIKLIVVGQNWLDKEFRNIRFTGHVSKKELRALYSGAIALVYPSIYEGFGLPVLEAFACHTPVVTSNVSSLPEVAGDAAIQVDPYKVEDIKEGIELAIKKRNNLILKGIRRLKEFSWEESAKETIKVYEEANT